MNAASHSKGVINEVLEVRLSHFSGFYSASLLGTSPIFSFPHMVDLSVHCLKPQTTNLQWEVNYIFIMIFSIYKSNILLNQ